MISSMTGFGRQRFEVQGTLLIAEVKSLNHRNLDIHCRLPEAFSALEIPLRNLVKKYISRGRVDKNFHRAGAYGDNSVKRACI